MKTGGKVVIGVIFVGAFSLLLSLAVGWLPFPSITKGVISPMATEVNRFEFDKGMIYSGEVENGRLNGKGTLTYQDEGVTYSGHFKNDFFDGKGEMKSKDGWSYTGNWKKGYASGKGVYKDSEGNEYTGEFKEGFREGEGVYLMKNGKKLSGFWEMNEFLGKERGEVDENEDGEE